MTSYMGNRTLNSRDAQVMAAGAIRPVEPDGPLRRTSEDGHLGEVAFAIHARRPRLPSGGC